MQQYFDTLTDDSGNALLGATVQVTAYPGGGAAPIYLANGTAQPIANSTVAADITGQVSFYAPDGAYILTYSYKGTQYKIRSPVQLTDPMSFVNLPDSGTANVYVITDQRLPAQLYNGLKVEFTALNSCSGASTFNLNGTGPVQIVALGGTPIIGGQIVAGSIYRIEYFNGSWQLVSLQPVTQAIVGGALYPVISAETTAGAAVTKAWYPYGDLRRYGGDPSGVADSSVAWQAACAVSGISLGTIAAIIPAGCSFLIVTGAAVTGQVVVLGQGKTSKLICDTTVLTVTSGTNSFLDNFWMENLTAPWIITRNIANWQANVLGTLQQSNTVLGYQPTVNDNDVYPSLTSAQQNQQVGPRVQFTGAASGITVSRIYGRFVIVSIRDATESLIQDCDIRGGKGQWGALEFDNWTNGIQRGTGNRAVNNRVQYSSFTGTFFAANDDFTNKGNQIYYGGESGTKTLQTFGVQFTASVAGATSGTLTSAMTNGSWTFVFSDASVRTVTITGTTACAWSGALATPSVGIITASAYQTALNPQCFRGQIHQNHCNFQFYDGCDCDSTFPGTNDAAQTHHSVVGNHCYNNGHDGINGDGQFNSYIGNKIHFNNFFGLWGVCSRSIIADNDCVDNNQVRNSSGSDISALGLIGLNKVSGNKVYAGPTQNNFGIYVPGPAANFIGENYGDGSTFFFGNPSAIPSVVQNYADAFTGLLTDQAFTITIANNGGVIQHAIVSDFGSAALGNLSSRINNASASFVNTPNGTDASTAFANGVKIGSATNYFLWFDVAAQVGVMADLVAVVATNSTGTNLMAMCQFTSININGVTRVRLAIGLTTTAGAGFAINTTNITSANGIRIQFKGKLS